MGHDLTPITGRSLASMVRLEPGLAHRLTRTMSEVAEDDLIAVDLEEPLSSSIDSGSAPHQNAQRPVDNATSLKATREFMSSFADEEGERRNVIGTRIRALVDGDLGAATRVDHLTGEYWSEDLERSPTVYGEHWAVDVPEIDVTIFVLRLPDDRLVLMLMTR